MLFPTTYVQLSVWVVVHLRRDEVRKRVFGLMRESVHNEIDATGNQGGNRNGQHPSH